MNCPKHIENLEQVINQIENNKNYVIVIDGNNRSFKLTETPEHGKTIVQTSKGNLSRIDFEIGYKMRRRGVGPLCDMGGTGMDKLQEIKARISKLKGYENAKPTDQYWMVKEHIDFLSDRTELSTVC
ncbi:XtrA/YqaO family protein [Bacillus vallismortis]|uniref:XtrA/YqaO family protein n=1 Tax=Bacillus vallismortis TaxID=72361 RepID=UPI002DDD859F|nr:XtrA/YqaO family protein [Bacillus vallismortis]